MPTLRCFFKVLIMFGIVLGSVACDMQNKPTPDPTKNAPNPPLLEPPPSSLDTYERYRHIERSKSNRECKKKNSFGRINFDCTISDENYDALIQNFRILKEMKFNGPSSSQLQNMLHLESLTGESLFQWLEERIQFILDETFDSRLAANSYAAFISRTLFDMFKSYPATIDVPGYGPVEIISSHTGVVLLGSGFFPGYSSSTHAYVNAVKRLSILLHEARHADGKGREFSHVDCPEWHPKAGRNCDRCNNGPYAVQSLFYLSVKESSDHWKISDSVILEVESKYDLERVLPDAVECDDRIEK